MSAQESVKVPSPTNSNGQKMGIKITLFTERFLVHLQQPIY